jgi:hypothetical protein
VKAAPQLSERYGETVCVAALSTDLQRRGWIRLYPINFRELASDDRADQCEGLGVGVGAGVTVQPAHRVLDVLVEQVTARLPRFEVPLGHHCVHHRPETFPPLILWVRLRGHRD